MTLREYVLELFYPRPYAIYRGVELNRCRCDGQIVTKNSNLANHAGHHIVSPVSLSLGEKILIWMKIIR